MKDAQASPFLLAALDAWGLTRQDLHTSISTGLINETYKVQMQGEPRILQRVHPVFAPEIHQNIRAVSAHLQSKGLVSPQLVPRPSGDDVFLDEEARCWRMQEYVAGSTIESVQSNEQAYGMAQFLAKWHAALGDIDHAFVGLRQGVHDTQAHRERLELALQKHSAHGLYTAVKDLATRAFSLLDDLPDLPDLTLPVAHGDPKIANLRFDEQGEVARAWIDLDTVGPMKFGHEIGDALRSWCNVGLEDRSGSEVDLRRFEAAVDGYSDGAGGLKISQGLGFLWGPCWIAAELGMRFAADALNEDYFGWDPQRYGSRGEHNLARATAQMELAQSFVATVEERRGWS